MHFAGYFLACRSKSKTLFLDHPCRSIPFVIRVHNNYFTFLFELDFGKWSVSWPGSGTRSWVQLKNSNQCLSLDLLGRILCSVRPLHPKEPAQTRTVLTFIDINTDYENSNMMCILFFLKRMK